jgi:diadenosine tetraphosphatase ApaH/serine/threonine PP2A family protein phosphatase
MRYLVISDIHANLEALDATLACPVRYDAILVLGDLVGYGADPNAVVERVRALPPSVIVRGNHDKVGAGIDGVDSFNHLARQAIAWTAAALTLDNREWLAALPKGPTIVDDLVEICHGAPFDEDVYLFDDLDAQRAFKTMRRRVCLFGHTHVPALFLADGDETLSLATPRGARVEVSLAAPGRYLLNCGAIGQPRDGDARAAFGLLDTDLLTLTMMRVPYDLPGAQAKIIAAGLPEVLARRLAIGR